MSDNRKDFEVFISAPPFEKCVERNGPDASWSGDYRDIGVQLAWEAFRFGRAQDGGEPVLFTC